MQEGNQQVGWQYTPEKGGTPATAPLKTNQPMTSAQPITWSASEYIAHDKSASWFIRFGLVAVASIGIIFYMTRDITSVILLGILFGSFAVLAGRKPSVLQYKLEGRGITIGEKFYPITMFRSFAVMDDGGLRSITLLPLKRLMPSISLYFAPDDERAILEAFSGLLPQETRKQDVMDNFMKRIRF